MDSNPRYSPLTASREPNPLRPYYRPATIDPPASSSAYTVRPTSLPHSGRPSPPTSSLSDTARDLLPELDLDFKASAGEAWANTRRLLDALLYRYVSVLLAQPFDVAKVILQVSLPPPTSGMGLQTAAMGRRRRVNPRKTEERPSNLHTSTARERLQQGSGGAEEDDEGEGREDTSGADDDDDVPDYFTSTAPSRSRSPRRRRRTALSHQLSPSPTPTPRNRRSISPPTYALNLKRSDSLTHVLLQLYSTSGAVGLWRASNTTFLYTILLRSTDAFIRSLLLAVIGLPEILGPANGGLAPALGVQGGLGFSGLDLSDSPHILGSLLVVGLSSCLAGLLLAPLDLVRTRLVITPLSHSPRGLMSNLQRLPSLLPPASSTLLPTMLSHTIPQLFSAACPLVLRRNTRLSPDLTPGLWSIASFGTCMTDLFLRLPLETLTRRAQVASLLQCEPALPLLIEPAEYRGVWRTVYAILYTEGETRVTDTKTGVARVRRGQGAAGLVKGWRIGFWGLVGVWGAGALGPADAAGKGKGQF